MKDIAGVLLEKGGPVAFIAFLWYLSDKRAWDTVDRLSASIVRLAISRAKGEGRRP